MGTGQDVKTTDDVKAPQRLWKSGRGSGEFASIENGNRPEGLGQAVPRRPCAIITLSLWTSIPTYTLVFFFIGPVPCSGCDLKRRMWLWHLRSPGR